MKHLAWIPLLVAPLALVALVPVPSLLGCSGSSGDAGAAPEITLLTIPPTATIGGDGNYDFVATISFTSPGGSPVNSILVVSQALSYSTTYTIGATTSVNSGSLPISFPVTAAAASGTQVDCTVTLVDEAGAQSTPVSGTVTLE
jgi:hypothetical protein